MQCNLHAVTAMNRAHILQVSKSGHAHEQHETAAAATHGQLR